MNKIAKRSVDMYDIGDGQTLMNVIQKNADGKMQKITTYIGIEGNGFVCVGNANELDAPGALAQYALLEVTGCDGYQMIKKISDKRFL